MVKTTILVFALAMQLFSSCVWAETVVRHPRAQSVTDTRNAYFTDLLQAALDVTRKEYGDASLQESREFVYQSRVLWLLEQGRVFDVAWTMTSSEREQNALPIRIPLMKGLLGVRLAIINKSNLSKFAGVHTLEDLRGYTALQGHDWPDTKILNANGLQVKTAPQYSEMFRLISRGRYDYFPRGVLEIFSELESTTFTNLIAEPNLVLTYPAPVYFFVSNNNKPLANRLEKGLRQLLASGEFDRLLRGHPNHVKALAAMNLEKRRVIRLKNPDLPPQTPLDDPALWWDARLFIR